jgi:protein-histidine pros-kinase
VQARTELDRANRELQDDIKERTNAEQKFKALLESAPDATIILNRSGEIVLVNAQAQRLFGYSRAELLGQRVEMLMPESFRTKHAVHRGRFFEDRIAPWARASLHALLQDKWSFRWKSA